MSIVRPGLERHEAIARLSTLSDDALETDLIRWELASLESGITLGELAERLQVVRDRRVEEEGWIRLYAEELRRRNQLDREEERS